MSRSKHPGCNGSRHKPGCGHPGAAHAEVGGTDVLSDRFTGRGSARRPAWLEHLGVGRYGTLDGYLAMPSVDGYTLYARDDGPRGADGSIANRLTSLAEVAAIIEGRRREFPIEPSPPSYEPPAWLRPGGADYYTDDGYRLESSYLSWTIFHGEYPDTLGSVEFLEEAVRFIEEDRARHLGFSSAAHRATAERLARLEDVLADWGLSANAAEESATASPFEELLAERGIQRLAEELRVAAAPFDLSA